MLRDALKVRKTSLLEALRELDSLGRVQRSLQGWCLLTPRLALSEHPSAPLRRVATGPAPAPAHWRRVTAPAWPLATIAGRRLWVPEILAASIPEPTPVPGSQP